MSENTKRLLTLVMAVSMLLSMMPMGVSAQEQIVEAPDAQTITETLPQIGTYTADPMETAESTQLENAQPMEEDVSYVAEITEPDQRVYFSFTPAESGVYIFDSLAGGDTYGELYAADHSLLAEDDDSGDANNCQISYQLTGGQTYYYAVKFLSSEDTGTIPVMLKRGMLKSLQVEPITVFENSMGWVQEYWIDETPANYYYYNPGDMLNYCHYTATFIDGTVVAGRGSTLEYQGYTYSFSADTEQSENNQWKVGNTYSMTASLMGVSVEVPVSVEPSPVVSLEFAPISVVQNTCGYGNTYWDEESQSDLTYYFYNEVELIHKTNYTAVLSDGTVLTGTDDTFTYNGDSYSFECRSNQSSQDPWTVGNTYTLQVNMLGKTVDVPVTITDVPLVSLSFSPVSVQENTCGSINYGWNPDTQMYDLPYYEYYIWEVLRKSTYTAVFSDGTVLTGSNAGLEYDGRWYDFEYFSMQDYENRWTVGNTYSVPVTLMGKQAELTVSIVPSPLVSLEFTPVTFIEGTNGGISQVYNPDSNTYKNFYRYSGWNALQKTSYTATFVDGTVVTGTGMNLSYNGEKYGFSENSNQSYQNQWLPGNSYYFEISVMGKTFQLPVSIEKSPLVSLTVEPITIIEGSCGAYNGEQQYPYFHYSEWQMLQQTTYTATFADGTVETHTGKGGFYYNDQYYELSSSTNQSWDNPWTVGNTYTMQVSMLGKFVDVPVTIRKTPVVSVEFQPIMLAENQDGGWSGHWGEMGYVEYFRYNWKEKLAYTITLDDGSVITGNQHGFSYNGKWQSITTNDSQGAENIWLAGNTYTETVSFLGYESQVPIAICRAENTDSYSYIVQNGNAIITDCHLEDEVIQIPDTIDGNTVVGITYLGFALDHALEISVPDSVTMLSGKVFEIWGYYEDVNVPLKKLHLGSGISNITPDMLMWIRNLEQITVSADNETYCSVDGVLYNKACTRMVVYPFAKTSHHVIPDTVENVDVIFEYGDIYKSISYQLGKGVKDYVEVDGVIYTKDMTEVVACTAKATGTYVMPDSVTGIRKLAFANSKLEKVTVSSQVTNIVYAAFYGSDQLKQIELPETLDTISFMAFDSCSALESIEIPASVTFIGSSAFYGCESLSAVYAADLESWCAIYFEGSDANPVKYAGKLYFNGEQLKDLVIPSVAETVYGYAFYNAELDSITVPSYVYHIGEYAFLGTTAQTLTLTEGLKTIEYNAFCGSSIQSVNLPDSLQYLGYRAFRECENLESVTIGTGLTEIPGGCFSYTRLKSVVLPENIEYVASWAFCDSQLTDVVFDCDSVYIGEGAFENNPLGDLDLKENIKGIDIEAFCGTLATKVNIPSTVTGLTYREFAFSYNLVSVTIPDSVEHIGDESFRGDINLSHVLYTGTEEQWEQVENSSPEINNAIKHFEATGDEVTTEQTCTQIKFYCSVCQKWETVNKVKANHNMVNGTCTVCGHVGDWEYQIDQAAGTVTITGYSGKDGELEIPATIQGKPVVAIAPDAFAQVSGIYSVTLPDTLEEIGESAFERSPHLNEVNFGENLKVIGDYAFMGCERLNTLKLPEKLETIGVGAFDGCYWLNSINIPKSVKTIGDYAFRDCFHLMQIILPQGLTRIGHYAFNGTLIQIVNIPDTVTEIGNCAFQRCERLESVTIPASVTSISYDAFSENFSLREIVFKGNAPQIAPIVFSGVSADAYYDADNDTWTEGVLKGYNGELNWIGCAAPRITKQPKDVYANEDGSATVSFECRGNALVYDWFGAMPGESAKHLDNVDNIFSMTIDEENSGYSVYCKITDPLGRTVTTKTVTMKLAPAMTGIKITKQPNTVEYDLNQGLRTTGMVVMALYNDGTQMEITNYQITGYRADQSGEQTITVAVGSFTDTYTVTVNAEVESFTNTEQNVEISAPVGAIDSGVQLVVEEIDIAQEVPEVPEVIVENEAVVFDVSLQKDGETVQPKKEVEVSIPVPAYMFGMGCKIFYVDDAGVASDMEARFEDGFMIFTVSHFSYYAIVQMPGVHITGEITGAETAVVNLKQNGEVVHTTQAEDSIYNFECVATGQYTLEVIAEGLDAYTTEITVGEKDLAEDVILLTVGDFTGDGLVTNEDVIHLLWYTVFPEDYPIVGKADFTGDGQITNEDVIHLLWYTVFPEDYPLV